MNTTQPALSKHPRTDDIMLELEQALLNAEESECKCGTLDGEIHCPLCGKWIRAISVASRDVAKLEAELTEANRVRDGMLKNINCGACAEGICCGSVSILHEPNCVYSHIERIASLARVYVYDHENVAKRTELEAALEKYYYPTNENPQNKI